MMSNQQIIIQTILDDKKHRENLIKTQNEDRKIGKFTDAVIQTKDGTNFPIHRYILINESEYFEKIFTKHTDKISTLDSEITSEFFEIIIDFIYTKNPNIINFHNYREIYKYSKEFQISQLELEIIKFIINNLSNDNCLEFWHFADAISSTELKQSCLIFIKENTDVFLKKFILLLTYEEIIEILKENRFSCSQDILFTYLIQWLNQDLPIRMQYFEKILENFNLNELSDNILFNLLNNENCQHKKKIYEKLIKMFKDSQAKIQISNKADIKKNPINLKDSAVDKSIKLKENCNESAKCNLTENRPINNNHVHFNESVKSTIDGVQSTFADSQKIQKISLPQNLRDNFSKIIAISEKEIFNLNMIEENFVPIRKCLARKNFTTTKFKSNKLLTSGGWNQNGNLNNCEYYSNETGSILSFKSMNEKRLGYRMITLNDSIYSCGGYELNGSMEICDIATEKWLNSKATMLEKEAAFGIINYEGSIYTFGGYEKCDSYSNTVERYDPREGEWIYLEYYLNDLGATKSICINNLVYSFGRKYCDIYDIRQSCWTRRISYPHSNELWKNFDILVMENQFYIFGCNKNNKFMYSFDYITNNWADINVQLNLYSGSEFHLAAFSKSTEETRF